MAPDEQDFLAAAGITDADFGDAPVAPVEAPAEVVAEEVTDGPVRDGQGRFAPKAAAEVAPEPEAPVAPAPAVSDAPDISAQFHNDTARAAWATVPADVRAEVARRFTEMQSGIEQYRERMEPIRRFDEMARSQGTTLDAALQNYTHIEQTLARNPLEGLDLICRNMGMDLRGVAAHILGQPAPERDVEVSTLQQRLHAAETELRGYRAEKQQELTASVEQFFNAQPRANELSRDIAWLVGQGFSLEDAYRKAEALNPLPTSPQTAVPTRTAAPQTPPANLSISGSPNGSNPSPATPALQGRQATEWAFAQAGL